jgi:hypothetical protein
VFTIPIGDILFNKQRIRQEETEGLDFIIQELEKVMNEQGAITYNIQGSVIDEDVSFKSTIKAQKDKLEKSLTSNKSKEEKKDIKEGLMRPLLMNLDSDEHNEEYGDRGVQTPLPKSQDRTPRKTPRDLMGGDASAKKKGGNLLTQGLSFFNKRDNKAELIKERKEEEEKRKRED